MRLFTKSAAVQALVLELITDASAQPPTPQVTTRIDLGTDDRPGREVEIGADYGDIYGDIDVTINCPEFAELNPRQEWFLERVARNEKCTAEDLANHWEVTLRTAKRDIGVLRDNGRIIFVGSRRLGRYVMLE